MDTKTALIIGAGPAGLTAAYEFLKRTGIHPIVVELSDQVGGIAKTISFQGNRIDIGGHRLFSKSDKITAWWLEKLPLQGAPAKDDLTTGRAMSRILKPGGPDPEKTDKVTLLRRRFSRIYAFGKFFEYPLSSHLRSLLALGPLRLFRIFFSYLASHFRPVRPEKTLEDFFINRFGQELYQTFFKQYTEKVWGVPCREIDPAWGSQRIQGVSVLKVIAHALKSILHLIPGVRQKMDAEASLISQFMYPKLGIGQLWEEVAAQVRARGGEILLGHEVVALSLEGQRVTEAVLRDRKTGAVRKIGADYFLSSMPVPDLMRALGDTVPAEVLSVARKLPYRSLILAGVLLRGLKLKNRWRSKTARGLIPDNWIYIQDARVKVGRIQILNNWSPYLVQDENTVLLELEYFCGDGDPFWEKSDQEIVRLASAELAGIGFIHGPEEVLKTLVLRIPKAYPAYFGTYERFDEIRRFTERFPNLFLIGRNGMHRYNNMDHSMMTAMAAVDNIEAGILSKDNLWQINVGNNYQEAP